MIKANVLRYAAIGMASLSIAGLAAASSVTVTGTGADSLNKVDLSNSAHVSTTNDNGVGVANFNAQGAESGYVNASKNTNAGSAASGDARNTNTSDTGVTVTNGGANPALTALAGMGAADPVGSGITIADTGADSHNVVELKNNHTVTTTNTNVVEVSNTNVQSAQSGNVNASKNTNVKDLTSGAATNSNTSINDIHVSN